MRFSMISTVSQTRTTSRVALASAWRRRVERGFVERAKFGRGERRRPAPGALISVDAFGEPVDEAGERHADEHQRDVEGDMRVDELLGRGRAEQAERRLRTR